MDESTAERSTLRPVSEVALEKIIKCQQELLGRSVDPEGKAKLEESQYNQALEWVAGLFADPTRQVYPSTEQPTPETFYYTYLEIAGKKYQISLAPSGSVMFLDTRLPAELMADRPPFIESRGTSNLPKVNLVSSVPSGMRFSADAPDNVFMILENFAGTRHLGPTETVITPEMTQKQIEEIAAAKVSLPRRAEPGK